MKNPLVSWKSLGEEYQAIAKRMRELQHQQRINTCLNEEEDEEYNRLSERAQLIYEQTSFTERRRK